MHCDFTKISCTGNDFIVFDNREGVLSLERHRRWFSHICRRRMAVGADGVILLQRSVKADFEYVHINSDGSIAAMCGNGTRAIALFAVTKHIAPLEMSFEIQRELYHASVHDNIITTQFLAPRDLRLELDVVTEDNYEDGGFINTGVPHFVIFTKEIDGIDVLKNGRKYRSHLLFSPDGANIDFVQVDDVNHIRVRTYERGVEDETLACGTGSVASAIISHLKKGCRAPIHVHQPGGDLQVLFTEDISRVRLTGSAEIIYEGIIELPAE